MVAKMICGVALLALLAAPAPLEAQGAQVAFGSAVQDSDAPVEVTADNLSISQGDGTAEFTGDVTIGQGAMRLAAPRVLVIYLPDQSGIERLHATGGVTLTSGEDAAEAAEARYNLVTGMIEMQGDVLLVRGPSALSAARLSVDTRAGTAQMSGQVKTVLQPGD